MFAMAEWWGQKWRYENVFGENRKCRDGVCFIKALSKEVMMANEKDAERIPKVARVEGLIRWVALAPG